MKHAYGIVAFNNWELLERLITLLDDERNDLYLHIDKNIKLTNIERFQALAKRSHVFFLERLDGSWGTPGLADIQLEFYKTATKKDTYEYYHLLSGVCLPLKTQDEIHDFFKQNTGKEFVHFVSKPPVEDHLYKRYSLYHFFLRYVRGDGFFRKALLGVIGEKISVALQTLFRVDRQADIRDILSYGSNWSSVTHELAVYAAERIEEIKKRTRYTFAPDECVLQTLVYSSHFKDRLYSMEYNDDYHANQRYIDWTRGNPYVWTAKDYDELMNSDYLFARKFDWSTDSEIIERICQEILKKQQTTME
ncbi:beta-1,6-N-acetylglucosaminyltransferase [Konateibacter massiliensis]|uniref:beta-1,6-N-acetylglucosaminyltransferase n=1 Tax=Konateibacter massiliensis TaxID=2002841 RepID=UPI000C15DE85|nr:beta-1,6-N-acetylglucosaminyltransferase [Konateibacter massiliensis]